MLKLYNTLTRRQEDFTQATGKQPGETVKVYTCGPTIYNFNHIGNLRTYIFYDVLERALVWLGYRVDRVMNITDVGHLTSDADEGEDKMDKAVAREGKSVEEIIQFYTDAFRKDVAAVNVRLPEKLPRASHFIPQQIELAQILVGKGYAYDTPEALYFDTSKLADYGKLTGQNLSEKSVGAREEVVTENNKKNPADFALWFKLVGRFEHHLMHWPSPWGEGFPGWHLECSAMIHDLLGHPIDIHSGGVDHIGTHHTNEIAQSEAAYGAPFANHWVHPEHLLVDNAKMAKSAGSFYTLQDIISRGIDPIAFRYLCLGTHYRTKLNFTWEALAGAWQGLRNLQNQYYADVLDKMRDLPDLAGAPLSPAALTIQAKFRAALEDDINMPVALAVLHETMRSSLPPPEKARLIEEFDSVFVLFGNMDPAQFRPIPITELPPKVQALINQRELCRKNQQFTQSDQLRAEINQLGYVVEDTGSGPKVYKRN
ncbi:MAG: cysteine--tRNA ligase [Candidatus Liptonbacteria bacterium]|nr:cysteine--tRNA ligase [Candidatus Liptonbacteria bacterium]